jgi:hypothetical protein
MLQGFGRENLMQEDNFEGLDLDGSNMLRRIFK